MIMPLKLTAAALMGVLLQGCFHNDNNTAQILREFQVDVINLTHNQTLAPVGLVLHHDAYQAFSLGSVASDGIELLAEGGDNSGFLSEAMAHNATLKTASGTNVINAGSSEQLMISVNDSTPHLSLAGMLVNTNDGFIAINNADLSNLAMGDSLTLYANIYDAGTEHNTEAATDLPGQGGEGYNATRDDRNFVIIHPGIVSQADGLATSSLNPSYRFDNPGVKVVITRSL